MKPYDAPPNIEKIALSSFSDSLAEKLKRIDTSFSHVLFRTIDAKGMTDADVYKRANFDRRLFAKLRKKGHNPSKHTAVSLAVALELNMDDAEYLISLAGYSMSPAQVSDVIVTHFINKGIFDFYIINEELLKYGQTPLGG